MHERITQADQEIAWAGASLDLIRDRWNDDGPVSDVLRLTGETRIPVDRHHQVLEQLRRARNDVQYLLQVLDKAST